MPRSGRLRNFIKEYQESPRFEKLSFIPPFLILIVECILLLHELSTDHPDIMVIELTTILLIISIVEILFVGEEIHDHYSRTNFDRLQNLFYYNDHVFLHYSRTNFDRLLTIRLDDFITKKKKQNVQQIVEEFTNLYPTYQSHRNEIYHIACQIMQTHKDEEIEKILFDALNSYFKKNKKKTVNEILKGFIKKYPKYKKYSVKLYDKICELKE